MTGAGGTLITARDSRVVEPAERRMIARHQLVDQIRHDRHAVLAIGEGDTAERSAIRAITKALKRPLSPQVEDVPLSVLPPTLKWLEERRTIDH